MISGSLAANIGQALVGLAILVGAAKSAYNGTLRNSYEWLQMIETIDQRSMYMEETQEEIIDALVALSHVQSNDDAEIDPYEVRKSFDRVDRSRSFIDRETRADRQDTQRRRRDKPEPDRDRDGDASADGGRDIDGSLIRGRSAGGGGTDGDDGSDAED